MSRAAAEGATKFKPSPLGKLGISNQSAVTGLKRHSIREDGGDLKQNGFQTPQTIHVEFV
jgi:hypothetical protein